MIISVMVPIRTENESNQRSHWAARAKRAASQRTATYLCLIASPLERSRIPKAVRLVRIGGRGLDDDGLRSALKAVRDAVACKHTARVPGFYDVDDGPKGPITWLYAQEPGEWAVRIEVMLDP